MCVMCRCVHLIHYPRRVNKMKTIGECDVWRKFRDSQYLVKMMASTHEWTCHKNEMTYGHR